ncbi:MAG: hypothetical protein L0Y71_04270 [Gemmataceae bacterium]|nr:hypothetical protein [Gemmataceae bacterium]
MTIQELQEQAEAAFEKDLPQLWLERPGQWVAYRGAEQLGFATQKHLMYQECLERGLQADEIAVFCIEPQLTEMLLGPMWMD